MTTPAPGNDAVAVAPGAEPIYRELSAEEAAAMILSAAEQKAALRAYAGERRWLIETGGVVWNGEPVPSDDRAKLLILGAAQTLGDADTSPLIIASVNRGTLTGVQFRDLNAAIVAHVQATFAVLAVVLVDIEAGTITTKAAIDAAFASS